MEDLLHDFLLKYFYDSTKQKRFEDRCRQMSRGGLSPQETEQLLDEIKKEATSISINYSDLESDVDLFQRFLDVWEGSGKPGRKRNVVIDIKKTASVNFEAPEGGWTPEALIACGWWQRPNLFDIKGIDDLLGLLSFLDLSNGKKSSDSVGKKICVYASTPERKKEIEKILLDNFTISELKDAPGTEASSSGREMRERAFPDTISESRRECTHRRS